METVGAIQETYNIWSWLLPLISGAIGALIGTYGGSYFLHWKQEKKIKNVRSMAVKALDIFKEYGTDSRIGLIASVMMSCTESVFYTMSVYFMAAGVKKTRYTLSGALLACFTGIVASVLFVC